MRTLPVVAGGGLSGLGCHVVRDLASLGGGVARALIASTSGGVVDVVGLSDLSAGVP